MLSDALWDGFGVLSDIFSIMLSVGLAGQFESPRFNPCGPPRRAGIIALASPNAKLAATDSARPTFRCVSLSFVVVTAVRAQAVTTATIRYFTELRLPLVGSSGGVQPEYQTG